MTARALRRRGSLVRGVLWLLCLCAAGPCLAVRHALLVGVSEYPGLSPGLQLKAPANDVRLMRQVLLQRGFDAAHIEVLADGVDGARLPTQAAILAALQGLAARAHAGDTVYLHFAGHGSLQWADGEPPAQASQPARWQPVFLPRDAQGWNGKSGPAITNAISDVVLRHLVDRISDTGAFVFAVFDACHSAKLVRGALPGTDAAHLRVRQVDPAALGLPGVPPPDVWPDWVARPEATTRDAAAPERRGKAVYFYAAQSIELAASLPLANGGEPEWHGLFSWHIAQALALGQPMTYRQLGQHVLSRFDLLPASSATPLFSGDGMDQPVFAEQAVVHRQWPLERVKGRLVMPAGALAGLAEGALLAVVADPLAASGEGPMKPPQGTLGFVRVGAVETSRSLLEPVAWLGWAAPSVQTLPAGSWARLMVNPPSFSMSVAIDRTGCRGDCLAGRALAQLQRDGVPGVDVRWVGASPDAWLRATESGVRLQLPGMSESGQGSWGVATPPGTESLAQEVLAQQTADALHRLARTRNLLRLASGAALRAPFGDVQLKVTVRHRGAAKDVVVPTDQLSSITPDDLLLLDGRNVSGDPVDLAAFWLGADLSINQVYPRDGGESPRLPGGAPLRQLGFRVDPGSDGTERLLVLMMPMRPRQEASDFRFLEQSPLSRVRGANDPVLQALLDACFADYRARGDAAPALPAERLGLQLFTFQVRP